MSEKPAVKSKDELAQDFRTEFLRIFEDAQKEVTERQQNLNDLQNACADLESIIQLPISMMFPSYSGTKLYIELSELSSAEITKLLRRLARAGWHQILDMRKVYERKAVTYYFPNFEITLRPADFQCTARKVGQIVTDRYEYDCKQM